MSEIKASVVIPTFNSAQTMGRCLASVRRNNSQYEYEIIIVDSGSTDETVELAKKYTDKVIVENTTPPRINRNKGIANAEGDIICFTDSDCVVPKGWVDNLVKGLLRLNSKDNQVVGVGGGNVPLLENPSLMELAIAKTMRSPLVSFRARNVAVYKDEREVVHNPPMNSAYFKHALEKAGGFEEQHGYGYGEDLALDAKLVEEGYRLYYLPDVVVNHEHPSSWKGFVKRMYAYGWGRVRLGRRFKNYFQFHHYGPLFLCLMMFSPLFFIPLGLGLINGAYMSFRERNPKLLFPLAFLTMSFHVSYGLGEIVEFIRGRE
jgi:glycosyltransferase involved in cell wall biosynthesis